MEFFLLSIYCLTGYVVYALKWDEVYESQKIEGVEVKVFQSPQFPQKYPPNIRYRYQFVARPDQKVFIKFKHFNIEGLLPGCNKDYLDMYIEMKSTEEDLIDAKLLGRFCGHTLENVPNEVVSLYHIVVMDFYSDVNTQQSYNQDDHMGLLGFNGTFQFKQNAHYYPGKSNGNCDFTIDSAQSESTIYSPTYPGIYPSNLNCSYVLIGKPRERIRLLFRDFDLNQQSDVCIDDFVIIHDGENESSPIIGQRFCGENHNLKVLSTRNSLMIRFVTGDFMKRSRLESIDEMKASPRLLQKKGFFAAYKFSEYFIEITKSMERYHIRGTECDMWIKSTERSVGSLQSPGFPRRMPPNKICTYFLYGIHNRIKMESAVLKFEFLNIPPSPDNKCSTGSLKTYSIKSTLVKLDIRRQTLVLPEEPDSVICGTNHEAIKEITCKGPLVLLRLNTSKAFSTGIGGFNLTYRFKRDYGIRGDMVEPEKCHFLYNISVSRSGTINSPFFNRLYPPNTTCQYDIVGDSKHRIRLYFQEFSLSDVGVRRQKYHSLRNSFCEGDLVRVIQKVPKKLNTSYDSIETSLLCGSSVPGPIVNDPRSVSMSLIFTSDHIQSHSGFIAAYDFIPSQEISNKCSQVISSENRGGIITSSMYPREYSSSLICQWSIKAYDHSNRIMIHFNDFVTEGSHQSCANSILRIYDGDSYKASSELCGTDSSIPAFISTTNTVHLRFITSPKALGQKGFKLIWSEIIRRRPDGSCPGFDCLKTKHCISRVLECDDVPNCGTYIESQGNLVKSVLDESDEKHTCPVSSSYNLLHVGLGIIITMLVLILLVVYVLYKEHRKQQSKTISTFQDDTTDGKLLGDNNVLLMSQINPPVIPIYHQPYNTQLSDIMSFPTHYNSGSSSSRPTSNLSQTLSNHYNYNRYSSRESMQKNALRRAHSTRQLRYPVKENNVAPTNNPYRNLSSQLVKSHNCNLNSDNKLDLFNNDEPSFYPVSATSDGGTWTREKMQKISMV